MKVNLFAPITPGADQAEADQGLLEIVNGYVDQVSGQPAIKTRPGLKEMHTLSMNTRVSLYWWEAKRILVVANGDRIYVKTSKKGELIDVTPANVADRFPKGVRVFFSADEYGVTMCAGLFMLWWGGKTSTAAIKITDGAAPNTITSLAYLKGYTIASILNTQQFAYAVYGPLDPRTSPPPWSPLYQSASASPDDIQCLDAGWEELFVLGRDSAQSHYASGDSTIPFPPLNGSVVETGIMNSECLQKLGNSWIFYTPHKQVMRVQGRTPTVISQSIEQELRRLVYFDKVHTCTLFNRFYVLNFYADQRTYVYDLNNGLWYRWGAWDETFKKYKRFVGFSAAYAKAWGQQYLGGFDGRVYEMSYDITHDNLQPIRLRVRSSHIDHGTSARKFSNELAMRLKTGVPPTILYSENPRRSFNDDWTLIANVGEALSDIFYASNGYAYVTTPTKIYRTLDFVNYTECTLVGTIVGNRFSNLAEASGGRIITGDARALWVSTDGETFTRSTAMQTPVNYWYTAVYPVAANPGEPYAYMLHGGGYGFEHDIYCFDLDTESIITSYRVVKTPYSGGYVGEGLYNRGSVVLTPTVGLMIAEFVSGPMVVCRLTGGAVTHQKAFPGGWESPPMVPDSDGWVRLFYLHPTGDNLTVSFWGRAYSADLGITWEELDPISQPSPGGPSIPPRDGLSLNDREDFILAHSNPTVVSRFGDDSTKIATSSEMVGRVGFTRDDRGNIYAASTDSTGAVYRMTSDPLPELPQYPDDPAKLLVRWRNDGKAGWSNYREIDLGAWGETEIVKRIRGLGQYRTRQYEIVSYTGGAITLAGVEENAITTTNP